MSHLTRQSSEAELSAQWASESSEAFERPRVCGKFLFVRQAKFWIRGVTYGTFCPNEAGYRFPQPEVVDRDFAMMVQAGCNSVRVYTPPERWLLDCAHSHGIKVMVGLPWEQHIAFLEDRDRQARIIEQIRQDVGVCAGHPAVLCYVIGNEIPSSVVRWHGRRGVEKFLRKLYETARSEDPDGLVTYVNFPPTEYLDLPFLDFVCFNVYLESEERLSAYLARLQNIAGERPLVMGELGLDSRRNGEERQTQVLQWQITASFQAGCAGLFVFAWTDEWHRGDHAIEDWDFGLTNRQRQPKPALAAVSAAFKAAPCFARHYPRISVLVCSFNGASTLAETLAKLFELNYPDYEVIVVDDGSTDATGSLAARFPVRLLQTLNHGLSTARNTALAAATGEIVAYIDDDAYPDEDWLLFLAISFEKTRHAAIGGPNISPPEDGFIADCVSNAPGGPMHILITDELAEHIPGCNMAFRREALLSIGGFDERFGVAGDDVDVCWRIQEAGFTIGFSAAAVVWHHRRNSIARYWNQQRGYARAEALLAEKWPSKYNGAGHLTWNGQLYGKGAIPSFLSSQRIYYGVWGSALFQSIYSPPDTPLFSLPLMPEWYFVLAALGFLSSLGLVWPPMAWLLPLFAAALVATAIQAIMGASRATFTSRAMARSQDFAGRILVAWLHVLQPAARLLGRVQRRLGPWRWRGIIDVGVPLPVSSILWREEWIAPAELISTIERNLRKTDLAVCTGNDFDRWDLSVRGGLFGSARGLLMVEEHGSGKQLFRLRAWPRVPGAALLLVAFFLVGACLAAFDTSWAATASLLGAGLAIALLAYADCAVAMNVWRQGLGRLGEDQTKEELKLSECMLVAPAAAVATPVLHAENRPPRQPPR